jgi:acetyl-CoA synthetase
VITVKPGESYDELRKRFRWRLPPRFNIGADVCRPGRAGQPAIIATDGTDVTDVVSFGRLDEDSNRLANALARAGVRAGDRVAIVLPQRLETALAHVAVYKLGAIAVPLSILFGPDALELRLRDSGTTFVIGEREQLETIASIGYDMPVMDVDRDLPVALELGSSRFVAAATRPDTPAVLIYTSGTTGPPKGALHAHRVLLGHLPGVELHHDLFPQAGDRLWTPADWAWIGGLFDVLLPSLHHGVPVVAFRGQRFDPDHAFRLIERLEVRNLFLPPTALRVMRQASSRPAKLRSVGSGGETLGAELVEWGRRQLGVTINEFYGQTEANLLVSNCSALSPVRAGRMGKAVPGHDVRIIDGEISVRAEGDPVVFLGYWKNEGATAEKIVDGWLRTGDLGELDDDGSFRFIGRRDDVISSSGYRIGPGEIEDCLMRHPAVSMAAVVGVPDELRGELVKAFVVLAPSVGPSDELKHELKSHVRSRLAAYEYPRLIEFLDRLPLTTTGKVKRGDLRHRERGDDEVPDSPEPRRAGTEIAR